MNIKLNTKSIYKIFIFLLIAMYMLETSAIPNFSDSIIHDVIQYAALLVSAVYIILRKYSIKELIRIFSLILIGILCYISSGFSGLLMTMLAITLMPKNCLDTILNMILKEEMFLFCIIVALALSGVLGIGSLEINKGTYIASGISLGFSHPNMLAAQGTSIILLYLCVNRHRLKLRHYVVSVIGVLILFGCSKGRTSLFLGFFAIFLIGIANKKNVKKKILKVLPYTYVAVFIILILSMTFYAKDNGTSTISRLINDGIFNGRIGLAYRSLLVYPVTLFGKAIDFSIWNQYQYFALDNGQIMLLLEFGIAGFLAYFYVIQTTLNEIKKEKEVVFGAVLLVFLIWSMYEGTMYFIGKNFALLFLGSKNVSSMLKIRNKGGKL